MAWLLEFLAKKLKAIVLTAYLIISAFGALLLALIASTYGDFIAHDWQNVLSLKFFEISKLSHFFAFGCAYVAGVPFLLITQIYYLTKPSSDLEMERDGRWFSFWLAPSIAMHIMAFLGIAALSTAFPFSANVFARPLFFVGVYHQASEHYLYKTSADWSDDAKKKAEAEEVMRAHYALKLNNESLVVAEGEELKLEERVGLRESISTIPFFICLGFTIIGWIVYCLLDLTKRVFLQDLYPMALYSYIGRSIFVGALAIVMAPFLFSPGFLHPTIITAMCFLIPFYPRELLQFARRHFEKTFSLQKQSELGAEEIPLSKLDGMNDYFMFRFEEFGINNVQNLCYSDIEALLRDMDYQKEKIIDFMGQGLLRLHVPEAHLLSLRIFGIRTAFDYVSLVDPKEFKLLAEKLNMQEKQLEMIYKIFTEEPLKSKIDQLLKHQNVWTKESCELK